MIGRSTRKRWLDQAQAASHRGQYIDQVAAKLKIADFALTWLDGMSHLKPSAAARYAGIVRVHIEPEWGRWTLGEVRHSDVTGWIGRLVAGGAAPGTVRQIHRVFSMIMDTAIADGRIAQNPASKKRLPSPVRAEPRFLSASEVTDRVRLTEGEGGLSIAVLAFTGPVRRAGRSPSAQGRPRPMPVDHRGKRHCDLGETQLVHAEDPPHSIGAVPARPPRAHASALRRQGAGRLGLHLT